MSGRIAKAIIFAGILTLLFSPCFGFQNEPDGFRGIKYGEDISGRNDMVRLPKQEGQRISYTRKGDKPSLGDVNLDLVAYRYYDGKFEGVSMLFKNDDHFRKIKDICFERYGETKRFSPQPESYGWIGEKSHILLRYNSVSKKGGLTISSVKIYKEQRSNEKKKAKAVGEKDF